MTKAGVKKLTERAIQGLIVLLSGVVSWQALGQVDLQTRTAVVEMSLSDVLQAQRDYIKDLRRIADNLVIANQRLTAIEANRFTAVEGEKLHGLLTELRAEMAHLNAHIRRIDN